MQHSIAIYFLLSFVMVVWGQGLLGKLSLVGAFKKTPTSEIREILITFSNTNLLFGADDDECA